MSKIWTFGCSFTAEYDPVGHPVIRTLYDDYKEWKGGYLPKVWPTLLGEKLNYETKNLALGGSSNYEIFRQFLSVCEQIKKDDILIFGWTSILRFNVVNFCQDIFNNVLPNAKLPENCINISQKSLDEFTYNRSHPKWATEIHGYIKLINLYIKNIGAHVFHWTSDDKIFNNHTEFVNHRDFILPKRLKNNLGAGLFVENEGYFIYDLMGYMSTKCAIETNNGILNAKIIEETEGKVADCHFGEFGHKYQSDYFYNHIKLYVQ